MQTPVALPFWRGEAHLPPLHRALLQTADEGADEEGDALCRSADAALSSDSGCPTFVERVFFEIDAARLMVK